jgi:DNA-binding NarL/FixJ family response regulator
MPEPMISDPRTKGVEFTDATAHHPTQGIPSREEFTQCRAPKKETGAITTTVALAIASPALLRGLEALLHTMPGLTLVRAATTLDSLTSSSSGLSCDVAIVDGWTGCDSIDRFLARIRAAAPATRVLLVIDTFHPFVMREALRLGAAGFIAKTAEANEILAAVKSAACGRTYVATSFSSRLDESIAFDGLTQRELQVLGSLSRGGCNKTIARDLDVSIGTVKTHVRSIMSKLESRSRTDVALKAIRLGLVGVEQ